MPGGVSAYLTFANANRNAVRDELLLAQGADGTGKIGIAQVSASDKKKKKKDAVEAYRPGLSPLTPNRS